MKKAWLLISIMTISLGFLNSAKADAAVEGQELKDQTIYTVNGGDTLSSISNKYNLSLSDLLAFNPEIKNASLIFPGEEIKLTKEGSVTEAPVSVSTDAVAVVNQTSKTGRTISVESTAYSYQQPGLSYFTATGINLSQNPKVIAVDPNVIPLGSKVYVEGYGEAIAGDTGGAIKGNRIDVHLTSIQDCLSWGRKTVNVTIL